MSRPDQYRALFARSQSSMRLRNDDPALRASQVSYDGSGRSSDMEQETGHRRGTALRRKTRRGSTCTTSKLPSDLRASRTSSMHESVESTSHEQPNKNRSATFTPLPFHSKSETGRRGLHQGYSIGEPIRCPSHMIVEESAEEATRAVGSLQVHDCAFIKRSDGSYSYAILTERSFEPSRGACMTFIVDEGGSTKMIRKKHWSRLVRVLSVEGLVCSFAPPATPMEKEDIEYMAPVVNISFVPQRDDDEWSLISSVSERARRKQA